MRKHYELTVILSENDEERKQGLAKLDELFKKHNVKVLTRDEIGLKTLAYEINDKQKGFYVFFIIDADNMSIDKISVDMRLTTLFMRFLIVRKDEPTSAQKARKEKRISKIREHLARKAELANQVAANAQTPEASAQGESNN